MGFFWAKYSDEELLNLRVKDLRISFKQTSLDKYLNRLSRELKRKKLTFRPHVWLSDDWFTPDGISGFAIPFYVAHPRLIRLEKNQMGEVEGEGDKELMKLFRHECGHAFENAYRLRRKKSRRKIFGKSSEPYRRFYSPDLQSRHFVRHLDNAYSQSHPDEDFAETFAVWLDPSSDWERRYALWPALEKLRYMDLLMSSLQLRKAPHLNRCRERPLKEIHMTLGTYYRRKRRRFSLETSSSKPHPIFVR